MFYHLSRHILTRLLWHQGALLPFYFFTIIFQLSFTNLKWRKIEIQSNYLIDCSPPGLGRTPPWRRSHTSWQGPSYTPQLAPRCTPPRPPSRRLFEVQRPPPCCKSPQEQSHTDPRGQFGTFALAQVGTAHVQPFHIFLLAPTSRLLLALWHTSVSALLSNSHL